jgi:hypothetical protein
MVSTLVRASGLEVCNMNWCVSLGIKNCTKPQIKIRLGMKGDNRNHKNQIPISDI